MGQTIRTMEELVSQSQTGGGPGVKANDSMAEAGRKILRFHFVEMQYHESGTRLGEDIEALHDMRVATRRMRAAFSIFGKAFRKKVIKPFLKGLRNTGRALGSVRDLDVFMEKAQKYLDGLDVNAQSGLDPLLKAWQLDRVIARERMITYLDSTNFGNFKIAFAKFVNMPGVGAKQFSLGENEPILVRDIAPKLIYTCMGDVCAFEPVLKDPTIEQLHALRIEFKKLRYTVEFFREVFGDSSEEIINDLKKVQDHLGDLNDADVACHILSNFLNDFESRNELMAIDVIPDKKPITAYLDAKHVERQQLIDSFYEVWRFFNRLEFKHNLALAISVL